MTERDALRTAVAADRCGSPTAVPPGAWRGRRIGPWGTATRAGAGIAALALALLPNHGDPWLGLPAAGSRGWGLVGGLLIVPVVLTLAVRVRGRSAAPFRAPAAVACIVTAAVVVLWQIFPVAVFTFIGASLLLLVARGDDGCELLAIPNWLLGRRDYLMCLPFTPVDQWESQRVLGRDERRAKSGERAADGRGGRPEPVR
jgi:hypothetical protein